MSARIHIERMMHRSSIAATNDATPSYALIKLIPAGGGARPLNVNLAIALDVSGSMYEEDGTGVSRLSRIQAAAKQAIRKLKPSDTLALVAFAHDSQVVLPATSLTERAKIEDHIDRIDLFNVDPGGTAMDQGIEMGLAEVAKHTSVGKLSQLIVLTDGETSGERRCRALAQHAAQQKVRLMIVGVGTDWNQALIKDLAKLGEGDWAYIDVQDADSAARLFEHEFASLAAAAFLDVELHLRVKKDVKIKRVRQVVPEIKLLTLAEPEERHLVAQLGMLERDRSARYMVDLDLPRRPDGKFSITDLEVTFDPGTGKRDGTGPVPLEIAYTAAGNGPVNAEVMKHIDELEIKEKNDDLQIALVNGDRETAKLLADEIIKQGTLMGDRGRRKTQLAMQIRDELQGKGTVSRKTQLALDDEARNAGTS